MLKAPYYCLLLYLAISLIACQNSVDLIVHNASIYTMNDKMEKATAFVIKNGKFVDVGGEEILKKYSAKKILNLQQLPVYPGFIDSHCHFLSLGLSLQQVDLVGTKSFDEVIQRVSKYSKKKNLKVILGRGWDQNDWADKVFPNKATLDKLFPNIPVALRRIDGHALLVNQKALDLAGIDQTTSISGGTIVKEKGKLTGVLIDSPMKLINAILPEPSIADKVQALKEAAEIGFQNGLTTVSVAGLNKDDIYLIDSLHDNGELEMRVYAMISNTKENMQHFLSRGPILKSKLTVRSFKIYADGALGSRGAALKHDYSDFKFHKGKFITPKDSIKKLAKISFYTFSNEHTCYWR